MTTDNDTRRAIGVVGWIVAISLLIVLLLTATWSPLRVNTTPSENYLLVTTADSGSFTSADDAYELVLQGVPEYVVYFSDRPERDAGTVSTAALASQFSTVESDPPNAAIVVSESGVTVTVVVTLTSLAYDAEAGTLSASATILDIVPEGLNSIAGAPADELPTSFGTAEIFIDAYPTPVNGAITDSVTQVGGPSPTPTSTTTA